jgi:hypothetical protein
MTNKPLVALGVVLALAGLAMMIGIFAESVGPDPNLGSAPQPGDAGDSGFPSYIWPVVAGITLAIGAACIMLGMNRWTQGARR